jgi:molybdopterin/thiamine biosynthesis adenylyltransferase
VTGLDDAAVESARVLDDTVDDDATLLDRLRADPAIEHLDSWDTQRAALTRLGPTLDAELTTEEPRYVYYPWRRAVVKILGPRSFRRLRLDRNRNLITSDEQDRLGRLRVGVVGLSSGHVVAHTLAMQGLCGELRLADFDDLELSNLNRIPAGVFDLGVNKSTVASRRIAELDPYLTVRTVPTGVTAEDIDGFLDGLDIVVEECDSLDVKALVRQESRARGLPVVMATSDRGMVDVERFDVEPDRPIFHGMLGDVDPNVLAGLSGPEKVPYVMRLIEVGGLTARGAASLLEVGYTLSTWPQLAGDVTLGAGAVAEAVRRIGLDEPLSSGRISLDVGAAFEGMQTPTVPQSEETSETTDLAQPTELVDSIVAAAVRAPSGGNVQPWAIAAEADAVTVRLDPGYSSTMDVALRASAVAVGAAVYNARVAAAARGVVGQVEFDESVRPSSLQARIRLMDGVDDDRAGRYPAMLRRETNRHHGTGAELPDGLEETLAAAAHREGARLRLISARDAIDEIAGICGAADRIRYLTPRLHAEMASELRWPGDPDADAGIDVRSLELGAGGDLALDILRRPEVMAQLAVWDGGGILGADSTARIRSSSALAVVSSDGHTLTDYARGGSGAEAVWVVAQEHGLAVQPISPSFLYAIDDGELADVAPGHTAELADLRSRFLAAAGITSAGHPSIGEVPILLLRLAFAAPTTVRSRRRRVNIDVPQLP